LLDKVVTKYLGPTAALYENLAEARVQLVVVIKTYFGAQLHGEGPGMLIFVVSRTRGVIQRMQVGSIPDDAWEEVAGFHGRFTDGNGNANAMVLADVEADPDPPTLANPLLRIPLRLLLGWTRNDQEAFWREVALLRVDPFGDNLADLPTDPAFFDDDLQIELRTTFRSVLEMNSAPRAAPIYLGEDMEDEDSEDRPHDGDYQD
jgi:hypothetical protein